MKNQNASKVKASVKIQDLKTKKDAKGGYDLKSPTTKDAYYESIYPTKEDTTTTTKEPTTTTTTTTDYTKPKY